MKIEDVIFLAGNGNLKLGTNILKQLAEFFGKQYCSFGNLDFDKYEEKELNNKIVEYEKVKGKVVVFYQSIYKQKYLIETLDFVWALKHQYGAKYIIGIFPFLWNRRQDSIMDDSEREEWSNKEPKPGETKRLEQTIDLLKHCGVDEMMVATPHSPAMAKACKKYGIIFHEIDPSTKFAAEVQTFIPPEELDLIKVYAPDSGSVRRAVNLAKILHCEVLFSLKNRPLNNISTIVVENDEVINEKLEIFRNTFVYKKIDYCTKDLIKDKVIVMVEDEVKTGKTANDTAFLLKSLGARSVYLVATHPVLTNGWKKKLFFNEPFEKVFLTNTIPRGNKKRTGGKIFDITVAKLFARVTYRILKDIKI